jgi:ABC-type antimicrobial peptide transport system permease subunit
MKYFEIATLRAIGFGAIAVTGAIITEAVLLALLGSAVGTLIAL